MGALSELVPFVFHLFCKSKNRETIFCVAFYSDVTEPGHIGPSAQPILHSIVDKVDVTLSRTDDWRILNA
jgi:hypothetical protein